MKIQHLLLKGSRIFKPTKYKERWKTSIFHITVIDGGKEDYSYYLDDWEYNKQWGVDRWISRKELDDIIATGKIYGVSYGHYRGHKSLKSLLRKLRSWNLPKGIKFEVCTTYSKPLYIITT